ncbi:MAG: hypothetical protein ABI981_06625 [Betaproteobacteria bacterium]
MGVLGAVAGGVVAIVDDGAVEVVRLESLRSHALNARAVAIAAIADVVRVYLLSM